KAWTRSLIGVAAQAGKARRAAATAWSTSAAPPSGTRLMTAPVEGLSTSRKPGPPATASPPIQCLASGCARAAPRSSAAAAVRVSREVTASPRSGREEVLEAVGGSLPGGARNVNAGGQAARVTLSPGFAQGKL